MDKVNEIRFTGYLGKDAVVSKSRTGKSVAEFTIALNTRSKKGDEYVDNAPIWFKVIAWEGLADKAGTLREGTPVCVIGRLAPNNYQKGPELVKGLQISLTDIEVYEKAAPKEERGTSDDSDMPF